MNQPESVGIRELRRHAAQYVAMAKRGQRVPITERGKLVAYLVPAHEPTSTFQRMVAAGQVRLATRNITDTLASMEPLKAEPGQKSLSETLREMRGEERY
ncbi:MAG: type II toxin-antitoxin system Phd/YefM family antitoxin [Actinomycetes bacterium]